ncbi:MAG: hypothetical protein D4R93_03665 [Deltaproteobacteria bacterium]|nr:MAG: hypothetical protein D4R93_03665 [Deltaproteobacteria bacterium]
MQDIKALLKKAAYSTDDKVIKQDADVGGEHTKAINKEVTHMHNGSKGNFIMMRGDAMNKKYALLTAVLLLLAVTPAFAFDRWHTENVTFIASKTSGYDYITYDAVTKRLFLGHRGEGLQVFDPVARKLVATIPGTPGRSSNGATIISEMDLGIINNEDGTFMPLKLSALAAGEAVKLAEGLDTSHYDPASKRLVFNVDPRKDGTDLVVVDATTLKTVGTIAVPTRKAEGAAADGLGRFYLAGQDIGKILVLDTQNLKLVDTWASPTCGKPTAIEVDAAVKRLFVSCRSTPAAKAALVVLNTETGATVWSAEIGDGTDGLAYDAPTKRIFSTNDVNGNLTVAEMTTPDKFKIVETLSTYTGVKVIAMDHENQKLYSIVAEGTANTEKKINTAVSPYYANTFFPNTFRVITFSK